MAYKTSKILTFFLACWLSAMLLVACSQDASPTPANTPAPTFGATAPTVATTSAATTPANVATPTLSGLPVSTTLAGITATPALPTPVSKTVLPVLPTATPLASDSLRSYLDNDYQFGMVYPSDWKVNRTPGRILFTSPLSQQYGVSVDIVPVGANQSARQALEAFLTDFVKRNPDTAVSNPSVGLGWGGIDVYGAFIVFPPDPAQPQLRVKAFVEKAFNDGVMYSLIASSEQDKYAERQSLLQICLNSFLPLELTLAGKHQTDSTQFADFGTKFNYPKSWQLDKKTIDAGTVLTIAKPTSPDVNLVMQISQGSDPVAYNKATFEQIQSGAADYNAVQYKTLKLNATQNLSRWVVLFVNGKGLPIYRYLYTLADSKSGLLYSLQASAFATHYLENSDALIAALQSLSVN